MLILSRFTLNQPLRQWIKSSPHPAARALFHGIKSLQRFEIPAPKLFWKPVYCFWQLAQNSLATFTRVLWWTPLFKSRCTVTNKGLYLYGGMPWIAGPLHISVGKDCRISGQTTLTGRSASVNPELIIGDNIDLGWQCTVAVGTRIIIGNNVRIAGQCFLAGYPGHPINAQDRAAHKSELDNQAQEIVLADDVWLGTGVKVLAGVHIGQGTIVGTGSVVTKDLPAGVIAAGNPARVIRKIEG